MILLLAGYCLIGLGCGMAAAVYEYRDGAAPGSIVSAGAVGLFVLMFWPVIALVVLLGWFAFLLSRVIRHVSSKEPR